MGYHFHITRNCSPSSSHTSIATTSVKTFPSRVLPLVSLGLSSILYTSCSFHLLFISPFYICPHVLSSLSDYRHHWPTILVLLGLHEQTVDAASSMLFSTSHCSLSIHSPNILILSLPSSQLHSHMALESSLYFTVVLFFLFLLPYFSSLSAFPSPPSKPFQWSMEHLAPQLQLSQFWFVQKSAYFKEFLLVYSTVG